MAFSLSPDREEPGITVVAEYSVVRTGAAPYVRVRYEESLELEQPNALGMVQHRKANTGRTWELILSSAQAQGKERLEQMLGTVMFSVLKAGCQALGVEKSDAEIFGAVMALHAAEVNIDGLLATEAEKLEMDRQLGLIEGIGVVGYAPAVIPPEPPAPEIPDP
jgi:hypothetical protein